MKPPFYECKKFSYGMKLWFVHNRNKRLNTNLSNMTYQDPQQAFDIAILSGRLSQDINAHNYAGNYMYMGTNDTDDDLFKHINTRNYLA